MAKKFALMLVALLVLGFTVAGCGDDDEDSGSGGDNAAETQTSESSGGSKPSEESEPSKSSEPSDKPSDDGGGTVDTSDPQVKQAIEQCKSIADANPQLSQAAKDKVGEVCEEAASGDAEGATQATKEVCEIIVEETAPSGAAKEQALAACEQTTTATP